MRVYRKVYICEVVMKAVLRRRKKICCSVYGESVVSFAGTGSQRVMAPVRVALLLLCLGHASAASCQDTDYLGTCTSNCGSYKFFVCSNVHRVSDYYHYVQQALHYPNLWFVLKDSHLDYYPAGSFTDGNLTVIEFRNARVNSFTQFDKGPNPFLGAEQTVKAIVFREDSSLPGSWALFSRLAKLTKVEFRDMAHLELTSDFNLLPASVEKVYIYNSSIGYVHPGWLSQLNALRVVIIRDTNLNQFVRSMLPRPAPLLKELDLEYVYNARNPLRCDCHLKFLVEYEESWTYSECALPENLRGRYFGTLSAEEMTCD
ncbi:uncharacterized protein [Dermacentor andersoni]|uniref:uncharacterized protein isoform X2 n=1 Tax=Dermacentor andersoni TaxID=34620 RepID=UPI002416AC9B|nr:uncharacterized protein LOC126529899 isoform X2 [Dermacentor andersoni]